MMGEYRQIKPLLLTIVMLQFTGALSRQLLLYYTVRDGDDVTLSCENVLDDHQNCHSTTWNFDGSGSTSAVELVAHGQIRSKSDRLSVTTNCSLVIKNVTDEDVGRYTCRQYDKSGQQQGSDALVLLSVVTMTEHKDNDQVTLTCSVRTYEPCRHPVKWLYRNQDPEKDNKEVITSQSYCSASVKFPTSHFNYTSRYKVFKCQVTTETNEVQLFTFSRRPSDEDTKPTTSTGKTTTESATNGPSTKIQDKDTTSTTLSPTAPENNKYVLYIIVAVVLVALLIIVVKFIKWKKSKVNNTPANEDVGLTSNPAETESAPGTSQDMADPEDGVSYASISYTKNTNSRDKVPCKIDDDEGAAVIYSTVNASSADPNNLYSTVNFPNK